eukprot:g161.t1
MAQRFLLYQPSGRLGIVIHRQTPGPSLEPAIIPYEGVRIKEVKPYGVKLGSWKDNDRIIGFLLPTKEREEDESLIVDNETTNENINNSLRKVLRNKSRVIPLAGLKMDTFLYWCKSCYPNTFIIYRPPPPETVSLIEVDKTGAQMKTTTTTRRINANEHSEQTNKGHQDDIEIIDLVDSSDEIENDANRNQQSALTASTNMNTNTATSTSTTDDGTTEKNGDLHKDQLCWLKGIFQSKVPVRILEKIRSKKLPTEEENNTSLNFLTPASRVSTTYAVHIITDLNHIFNPIRTLPPPPKQRKTSTTVANKRNGSEGFSSRFPQRAAKRRAREKLSVTAAFLNADDSNPGFGFGMNDTIDSSSYSPAREVTVSIDQPETNAGIVIGTDAETSTDRDTSTGITQRRPPPENTHLNSCIIAYVDASNLHPLTYEPICILDATSTVDSIAGLNDMIPAFDKESPVRVKHHRFIQQNTVFTSIRHDVAVNHFDRLRLLPGQWLNDTLIDFYLAYLTRKLRTCSGQALINPIYRYRHVHHDKMFCSSSNKDDSSYYVLKKTVHSVFFMHTLKDFLKKIKKKLREAETDDEYIAKQHHKRQRQIGHTTQHLNSFKGVCKLSSCNRLIRKWRKWTKGFHTFGQDLILVPIVRKQHWSLLAICNPRECLRDRNLLEDFQNIDKTPEHIYIEKETRDPFPTAFTRAAMLSLDSLSCHRTQASTLLLREFLEMELEIARHDIGKKKSLEYRTFDGEALPGFAVSQIPKQKNSCDCGVFTLHYAEKLLSNAFDPRQQGEDYIIDRYYVFILT